MAETPIIIEDPKGSRDNEVRPFQIDQRNIRGRAVRLGTVADHILAAHDYPDPVNQLLGEFMALASLLASIIKVEATLTLQTRSSGAISMLVVDCVVDGAGQGTLRAMASLDQERTDALGEHADFADLMGHKDGYLALTIDRGDDTDRYQGIVPLSGDSLSAIACHYFEQSEQIPTEIQLSSDRDPVTGHYRAGGIMIQHLSRQEEGGTRLSVDEARQQDRSDAWNRISILMNSVKNSELLATGLDLDQLLYRLFHEDGVRVFDALHLSFGCRCSDARLGAVLANFDQSALDDMYVDGMITVRCDFCSREYHFTPDDVARLRQSAQPGASA